MKVKLKQAEIDELNKRFEDHMKSNERTEKSLHERIGDMQSQIDLLKQLREEDKYQVDQTQKLVELKESEIEEKE